MAIGSHRLEYEVVQGWERLPEGWAFTEVVGVAVDSRERVFVFCRGPHPLIVFDKEGRFVDAWGAGRFVRPHGIFISPDDRVFLVDDEGHTVYEYSTQGELRRRLGDGQPSDTGYVPGQSPVTRGAGPFNTVTNVALAPDGELYVADGYGNARVHRFAADGRLLGSWGEPGSGPGQFNLPARHRRRPARPGLRGRPREQPRPDLLARRRPPGHLGLAEPALRPVHRRRRAPLRRRARLRRRQRAGAPPPAHGDTRPPATRRSRRSRSARPDGELIGRVGGEEAILPGNFFAPHGLCVSPRGDLYVGEVVVATGVARRLAPLTPHCFQKFVRRSG